MRYCPVPSLTTVRVFSMRMGLDASTVTPGKYGGGHVADDACDRGLGEHETGQQQDSGNRCHHVHESGHDEPPLKLRLRQGGLELKLCVEQVSTAFRLRTVCSSAIVMSHFIARQSSLSVTRRLRRPCGPEPSRNACQVRAWCPSDTGTDPTCLCLLPVYRPAADEVPC